MSLLFFGLGGTVVTETFTSSTTWYAPASTNKIMKLVGRGSDGTARDYTLNNSLMVYNLSIWHDVEPGSVNSPTLTWALLDAYLTAGLTILNNPSSPTYSFDGYYYRSFDFGYYKKDRFDVIIPGDHVRQAGTAVAVTFHGATNPPAEDTTAYVKYYYLDDGAYGTASTAFGYSMTGGTPSTTSAPTNTYTNITVTPSAGYSIVVPSGGSVTITYAK